MNPPIPDVAVSRDLLDWVFKNPTMVVARRIAALERQVKLLTDPAAVHINILRGDLPLTKAQAIHIAGLPADIEEQVEQLRKALRPVSDEEWEPIREVYFADFNPAGVRMSICGLLAARADAAEHKPEGVTKCQL